VVFSQKLLQAAGPIATVLVATAGFVFGRQNFVATSNATSASAVQTLLRDYETESMGKSLVSLHTAQQKDKEKFAWDWAQAKLRGDKQALELEQDRRRALFFWVKFHVMNDAGVFQFRTFWCSRSTATQDLFPCKTRAEGFIKVVEPLDYANCRICLGKSKEECRDGAGKPSIYKYLRDLYKIEDRQSAAMDFVDKQVTRSAK
jgi:hypothetical protein